MLQLMERGRGWEGLDYKEPELASLPRVKMQNSNRISLQKCRLPKASLALCALLSVSACVTTESYTLPEYADGKGMLSVCLHLLGIGVSMCVLCMHA